MASTIGRLAVAVLGNIDDFKKNFGEAKKGVADFQKTVQKADVDLKKIGRSLTLVGTAMVGSLTAVTLAASKNAEQIDLLAKRTGASREDLQALEYAAKQEGTSLESLGASFSRLARTMVTAQQGNKAAVQTFKDLGININNSQGGLKGVNEVLGELADRIKNAPDETTATGLAIQAMGRSAGEAVPFLKMGSEEINRLMQEARNLGYVIDEEAIKQMEQLGDEIEAVKTGFAGLGRQIAADVAPALLDIVSGAKEFFKWIHQIPPDIRQFITQGTLMVGTALLIAGGLVSLITRIGQLKIALTALNMSFAPFLIGSAIFVGLTSLIGYFSKLREEARLAAIDINKINNINDLQKEREFWEAEIKRRKEALAAYREAFPNLPADKYNDYVRKIDEASNKLKQLDEQENKLNNPEKSGGNPVQYWQNIREKRQEIEDQARVDLETGRQKELDLLKLNFDKQIKEADQYGAKKTDITEKYRRDIAAINAKYDAEEFRAQVEHNQAVLDAYMAGLENEEAAQEEYEREFEPWKYSIEESTKGWDDWSAHMRDMASATANSMQQTFSSFFSDIMHGDLKNFADYFQSFADSILDTWSEMLSKMLAQKILSGIFGNTGTVDTTNMSVPGYDIEGRATGGSVTKGVIYQVEEKEPEFFKSNVDGEIIPLSKMPNAGANVQVNVINQTGVQANATQNTTFDGEKFIVNVLLKAINKNTGGITDAIAAASGA